MAITIKSQPYKYIGPAGQDWNWSFTSTNYTKDNFRFVVDLYMFESTIASTQTVRLKISPNLFNIGNVNLRTYIEQQISSDNLASLNSTWASYYKNQEINYSPQHETLPIHLIDEFATNSNSFRKFTVKFGEQYSATANDPVVIYPSLTIDGGYGVFNGVVPYGGQKETSVLGYTGGVELDNTAQPRSLYGGPYNMRNSYSSLLTNAPTTQYVRSGDYMTVGMLSSLVDEYEAALWTTAHFALDGFSSGATSWSTGTTTTGTGTTAGYDGSSDTSLQHSRKHLQFLGCGPGNLLNNTVFNSVWAGSTLYTLVMKDAAGVARSKTYTFKKMEDDCKGYETIRLTWLNRHGCWDYYNFTKKSYRELDIKREYTHGNKNNYLAYSKKFMHGRVNSTFSVNAKETIKANSDWVNDETAIWLEELYTSPEVYMLGSWTTYDPTGWSYQPAPDVGFVTPVQVVSRKYERYTSANDKVAQYEIEIEKDSMVNVQGPQGAFLGY